MQTTVRFQRGVQTGAGASEEALHVGLRAQGLLLLVPFGQHFGRVRAALGKDGAVAAGLVQRVLPLGLQRGQDLL